MTLLLQARHIVKSFDGRQVLTADDFSVQRGSRVSLIGSNGSGKTTMLKIIGGLLAPDSAVEWQFDGSPKLRRGKNGIVLAHQTPYMFSATVRDNIALAGGDNTDVQAALQWAGLSELADFPARHLSGGMQQRVSFARLYATRPQLCLLDEPFAHLDSDGADLVLSLADYLQAQNAAVLIAAPQKKSPISSDAVWQLHEGVLQQLS